MNDAINKAIEVMDIARKIAVDGSPYQAMLAEAIEALKAEQARQDGEQELLQLIDDRAYWEAKATDLAEKVGVLLGVDVGEHTSNNRPVENALGAIEEKEAEQTRQDCYVSVPTDAVNWLKEKFPQLCIKAGLCVKVGRRLYTITIVKKG